MNKLLIQYRANGYNIMLNDGMTEMEFVDGTQTSGIPTLKEAINICIEHEYEYEVI